LRCSANTLNTQPQATQDEGVLRRYRRRVTENQALFAWLINFRVVFDWEYYPENFLGWYSSPVLTVILLRYFMRWLLESPAKGVLLTMIFGSTSRYTLVLSDAYTSLHAPRMGAVIAWARNLGVRRSQR